MLAAIPFACLLATMVLNPSFWLRNNQYPFAFSVIGEKQIDNSGMNICFDGLIN